MNNIGIAGIGAYLPSLAVTNDKLSEFVDTNDEWISERTGIKERRISQGEDTSMLASKAAKLALDRAEMKPEDLDLIIVATVSPDMFIPSVACLVQSKLGAQKAACFDINVACSGFVYGLEIAKGMMLSMNYKSALVIGAEVLSKVVDWEDRSTCILFGDGSGAAVLEKCDERGIVKSYLKAEGDKWESLTIGAADFDTPFTEEKVLKKRTVDMNGREVFKFATKAIENGVKKIIEDTGISLDEIKYIVPHQANSRIIASAAKRLGIEKNKFYMNVDKVGNTSSASVPIALNDMYEKNMIEKGDKLILVAFGGGLTYGSTLIEW
ncbi:MAG TPA: 3-oxoacyl-ACP synthase [Clostridium sp.]|nr:3-oxoacyl-ACP synthase [Clostridium sp.]